MVLLFLALALTDSQQAQHDRAEWAIYQRMESDKASLDAIWKPNQRLLEDYHKVQVCYVRFHLYQSKDCDAVLAQLDLDLNKGEVARTEEH